MAGKPQIAIFRPSLIFQIATINNLRGPMSVLISSIILIARCLFVWYVLSDTWDASLLKFFFLDTEVWLIQRIWFLKYWYVPYVQSITIYCVGPPNVRYRKSLDRLWISIHRCPSIDSLCCGYTGEPKKIACATSKDSDQPGRSPSLIRVFCFGCFDALRPKSTAMVMAGRSVHLTTLFPG